MTKCNETAGERLLLGKLSEREEQAFAEHLESCVNCRSRLEERAGSAADWKHTRELLVSSAEIDHWPSQETSGFSFDPRLRMREAPRLSAIDLSFLAPADDPAFAGRIGPYQVTAVIGRGGMGIVLKAHDATLDRNVAIKVLDPALADCGAARQRFAREARAMAAISHEHVLPIYAVDEHQGLPYLAMEYVAGGTLENRLQQTGPLDVVSAVRIAWQVAQALDAAHESGLVHRDIKPANILLDRGIERVRVADFGLARIANEASQSRSGLIAGTPQFMAPEQVRGETCDARSDLFSLGSVMYAMLCGHAPFRAETMYGVMQRIVHAEATPISEFNAQAPAWLESFVEKLLAKDPAERFGSAAEVAEVLSRELAVLQNPRGSVAPEREWMRTRGGKQTKKWLAFASALCVAVAISIGAVAWWNPADTAPPPAQGAGVPRELSEANLGGGWGNENIAPLMERADALESSLRGTADGGANDGWEEDVDSLRKRISKLDRESP